MGDAKETAFPAESEPSGSPPRRAPTARFGLTGDYGEGGGRGEERWRGKGILFLPLPVQGEANLRWQSLKKLRKVWVAQLVVEAQGKQAVLGGGAGSALGSIGSPGLEAVKDPSVLGQVHPRPQKLQWASACRESEVVSSEDRQGRAESSAVLCRSGKHYPR